MPHIFKPLSVADVESAMLSAFNVPVDTIRVTDLSKITTTHTAHNGKNIVFIVSKQHSKPSLMHFSANQTVVPLLSASVDTASASLEGYYDPLTAYFSLSASIGSSSQEAIGQVVKQSNFHSFGSLMNSVTRFVCEDSRSKFIYVEADDKLLSDKGGLTSTALPLLQMIKKTAPNHTLTVVTSVPREISPSNTNPAQNLSALVVFGALLSNYKYRETVRYHETISTQNNPKKNLDDATFSNRLALHLLNLGRQNGK